LDYSERLERLEAIVEQTALAVLATTEVVERMGERIDFLSLQVQQQGQQFQQQGYQVYAITDAVQTLTDNQADSSRQLNELMITLSHLAKALEHQRR
jgi:ABC-type transporter Mla subunit MlaD